MKVKTLWMALVSAVMLLWSGCNVITQDTLTDITCSKTKLTFPASGGKETITVRSVPSWTAQANQSWITVSPTESDELDTKVTITVKSGADATGKVTFQNKFKSTVVTIVRGKDSSGGDDSGSGDSGKETGSESQFFKMSKYTMKYTLKGGDGILDVENAYDEEWTVSCDQDWVGISPKKGIGEIFTVVTLRVQPGYEGEATVTFREKSGNYKKVKVIRSNNTKAEEDEGAGMVTNGHLPGKFSVGPSKQVYFSAGNLQYRASQDYWRFASHQNYTVGAHFLGTVFIAGIKSNYEKVSSTYDGYIDMFCWGTGDQPYKTVLDGNAYLKFNEWGNHNIYYNGEKTAGPWRTMSLTEWQYLTMSRKDAYKKIGAACLLTGLHDTSEEKQWDMLNGIVLLPDDWTQPSGVGFVSLKEAGWTSNGYLYKATSNRADKNCENKYTDAEWRKMEAAGAVFIPANGVEDSEDKVDASSFAPIVDWSEQDTYQGAYWTCSTDTTVAFCFGLSFDFTFNKNINPAAHVTRYTPAGVRLVQDVK